MKSHKRWTQEFTISHREINGMFKTKSSISNLFPYQKTPTKYGPKTARLGWSQILTRV